MDDLGVPPFSETLTWPSRVNGVSYNFPILIRGPLTPSTHNWFLGCHLVGVDYYPKEGKMKMSVVATY